MQKISFLSEAINFEIRDVPDHLRNLIRITYLQQGNESPDEVLMTLDSMLDILESIDNAKGRLIRAYSDYRPTLYYLLILQRILLFFVLS